VEEKRTGLGTATMVKVNGKWLIAAFHNTLTSGPGYAFSPAPASPQASAEPGHHLLACPDSPTPGKRPSGADCAIVAHKTFTALPKDPVVLRVENFTSAEAAQRAAAPASVVVEAAEKIWLLTIGSQGERSEAGTFVTEIGPISGIPSAASYEIQVADADFGPEMNPAISKAVHTHSGPEIWYLLSGEQCLETPSGPHRAKAGEGMFAPTGVPMQLNITGTEKREALFAIVHDASQPATTVSEWQPKGLCQ
jgi:mannose-6-phosphate isomerase-like protein (cupin superfamily)